MRLLRNSCFAAGFSLGFAERNLVGGKLISMRVLTRVISDGTKKPSMIQIKRYGRLISDIF